MCDHHLYTNFVQIIKSRSHLRIDVHDRGQDGSFLYLPHRLRPDKKIFIRVSINPTAHGESVVLRLLDQSRKFNLSLEELGIGSELVNLIQKYADLENSLILISGSTGSGKTTTMYSLMNFLNPANSIIISLEDPVERLVHGVRQIPIRQEGNFKYSDALRVALRQDPDILVIGEIRDTETAQIAVEAALTGHLVIAGIHGRDSVDVVFRLLNLGVDAFLLSQTLSLSIHQKIKYGVGGVGFGGGDSGLGGMGCVGSTSNRSIRSIAESTRVDFTYFDFSEFLQKMDGGIFAEGTTAYTTELSNFKKQIKNGNE
jgi:type II secretory ATPase GspE/PulE/Tfp pilus assembly ATPase PilB-like protein